MAEGVVAAATAPLTLVTTLATFGIPEAVTWTVARHPHLVRAAAGRAMAILFLGGACAMAAVFFASRWLSGGDRDIHRLMLIATIAVIPNLLVGVLRGVASAMQLWKNVALERILASGLRLVALAPFFLTGQLSPLVATVILAVMPVMGSLAYLRLARRFPAAGLEAVERSRYSALLSYGGRVWIGSISGILLSRLDQTLMTPLTGSRQLGLYVVAVTVSELPLIINGSVRDVTFATDAAGSKDDRLAASARISFALCTLLGLGLGVTMVWWIPLLFGQQFDGSVPVAAILLLAVVLGTPGSIGGTGLSSRGRPGLRSLSLVVACLVNLGLLILLVPRLGAVGAAAATLVGNIMSSNLNLIFLSRVFKVPVRHFYGIRRGDLVILKGFTKNLGRRSRRPV